MPANQTEEQKEAARLYVKGLRVGAGKKTKFRNLTGQVYRITHPGQKPKKALSR